MVCRSQFPGPATRMSDEIIVEKLTAALEIQVEVI